MVFTKSLCGRGVERPILPQGNPFCCPPRQLARFNNRPEDHVRLNVAADAKVKAAAVESPAKTVDNKPKASVSNATADKLSPEVAADLYKDMKLGRDFEEMYALYSLHS